MGSDVIYKRERMRNPTRTFIPTHNNIYSHVTRQEKEIFYLTWRVFGLFLLVPERSMRRFHSEPPSSQLALWIGFSRKPVRIRTDSNKRYLRDIFFRGGFERGGKGFKSHIHIASQCPRQH